MMSPDNYSLFDEAGWYYIPDESGFAGLAVLVNGLNGHTATDFSGKIIFLQNDLDLSAHLWTPIGTIENYTTYKPFAGTFIGSHLIV